MSRELVPADDEEDPVLTMYRDCAHAFAEMTARYLRGELIDPAMDLPKPAKRLVAAYQAQRDGMSAIARDDEGRLPEVPRIERPKDPRPGAGKIIDL